MKAAITIPAYNEEKTIGQVIRSVSDTMRKSGHKHEILVVDDGSTDKTAAAARKAGATVISHPYNYGLAETFRTEIAEVLKRKADVIVHIDADGQYDPKEIPGLLAPIEKKEADLVIGSRFMGRIESMPVIKKMGNRAFSRVISRLINTKVSDCQTGFRAFTRKFAEKVEIKSTHTYTQEMIIKGVREKFRIKEVPVTFLRRKEGKSKLISNPFGYAARAWLNILRIYRDYEPLKFFGVIGSVLIFLSMIIGFYFVYLQLIGIGVSGNQGKMFLMLMLFFSGVQVVLFGFLADKGR